MHPLAQYPDSYPFLWCIKIQNLFDLEADNTQIQMLYPISSDATVEGVSKMVIYLILSVQMLEAVCACIGVKADGTSSFLRTVFSPPHCMYTNRILLGFAIAG